MFDPPSDQADPISNQIITLLTSYLNKYIKTWFLQQNK